MSTGLEGYYDVLSKGAQVYGEDGHPACVYVADADDGLAWARTCFGHLPELSVRRRPGERVWTGTIPHECDEVGEAACLACDIVRRLAPPVEPERRFTRAQIVAAMDRADGDLDRALADLESESGS